MTHFPEIPNWAIFKLKFDPPKDFIQQIESRWSILQSLSDGKKVMQHINVQIGILNMRDREQKSEIMQELSGVFGSGK